MWLRIRCRLPELMQKILICLHLFGLKYINDNDNNMTFVKLYITYLNTLPWLSFL